MAPAPSAAPPTGPSAAEGAGPPILLGFVTWDPAAPNGGAFAGLSTDFTGSGPYPAAGTLEKSDVGLGVLPALYYSQQVGEKTVIGLGVSRPFGVRS